MAASLSICSLEASIFSLLLLPGSSSNLRHIHDHQTRIHGAPQQQQRLRIAASSSQQKSGGGGGGGGGGGVVLLSFRGNNISRTRTLVFCFSSSSSASAGDGRSSDGTSSDGRSSSSSSDGNLEQQLQSLQSGEEEQQQQEQEEKRWSSGLENPREASALEHPFLPSRKQQKQIQEEEETTTTTGVVVEAAAAASPAHSALERAAAYRKSKASGVGASQEESSSESSSEEAPTTTTIPKKEMEDNKKKTVALSAFERAQAYRKQQAEMVAAIGGGKEKKKKMEEAAAAAEHQQRKEEEEEEEEDSEEEKKSKNKEIVEIEIYTRDGIVRRKVSKPETAFSNVKDIKRTGMSDMDFVGLGFADKKKSSAIPARLSDGFFTASPPTGALPEVEILTRDGAQKQPQTATSQETDLYKPRVSTWGVFPRPADISKTYGGGRTIRPGETLETPQEKEAREARTKKLLDDYRHKMGLDINPEIKMQCEKILKQGESLMDRGLLREALVAFESVMKKISFQSEVHGLAALQGAVCMDSLNRSREAKLVYEKLVSHPNQTVRKKAGQLLFGFQAAENLKVTGGYKWDTSTYRKYFDSFADGYNTMYKASQEDDQASDPLLKQSLPYAIFLIFPVLLVFTLAALKNS